MQIDVYTEGADSFVDDPQPDVFREYFDGTFMSARTLIEELDDLGTVSVHLLDDEYGYVQGSHRTDEMSSGGVDRDSAVAEFSSTLCQSARTADVLVVMLSKDAFVEIVTPQWDVLSDFSNADGIWCLASSQKALSRIEIESRLDQDVVVYHRSGVARIGIDAREALVDLIKQESAMTPGDGVYQEFGGGFSAQELLKSS